MTDKNIATNVSPQHEEPMNSSEESPTYSSTHDYTTSDSPGVSVGQANSLPHPTSQEGR